MHLFHSFLSALIFVQSGHQGHQNRKEVVLEDAKPEGMPSLCLQCQLDSVCHHSSSTQESMPQSFLELNDMTKHWVLFMMNAGWSYSLLLLGYLQTCSFYVALEPQGIKVWSLDQ
jgi:hypothetical protein